jgi:glycosyltransferase involved in cell wall biosynthesis
VENHRLLLVSVVIPTYNSQKTIRQCLRSIQSQSYEKIETIVVDRYSTDETKQTAGNFNAKVLLLNCERSAAKNFGARKANGEFLLFVDSDMELHSDTIEECVELCTEKNFDAAVIPETNVAIGFLSKCRRLERELYNTDRNFFLMPRFFRKKTFLNVSGFDEKLVTGEDFDLARRYEKQGYLIGFANSSIKHLEGELSFTKIVLKAHYYGKSFTSFFSKEPKLVLRGYCPTRFAWNIKRLLKQPICLAGLVTIKVFEYVAYLTGIFANALGKMSLMRNKK